MTEAYLRLTEEVGELRRQWRLKMLLAGVLLAAGTGLVVLLVAVAADNLFGFGTGGRLVLALLLWGGAAAVLALFVVRRWIERPRDDYFAAMVEQKHPELHNLLVNALQLGRANGHGSPRLIEAIIRDADTAIADLELGECLDRRHLQRAGWAAGAGAVLVGIYVAVLAPRFVNGASRVLLPLANIAPYTATQIIESSIKPGNARVPEGVDVTVTARLQGEIPTSARVMCRNAGKPWRPVLLTADATQPAVFSGVIPEATESFDYFIAAGDGRSSEYRIEVVKRPQIERLSLRYEPPSYAGQAPQDLPDANGEIAGLAGTVVTLTIQPSKPLRDATLVTEEPQGLILPLEAAEPAGSWQASFVIWSENAQGAIGSGLSRVLAPTRYHLRLLDTEGYENAEPVWHSMTVIKDQAPAVVITAPGRDLQLKLEESVSLAVESKDDYGLGPVRILYRVNEEATPRVLAEFSHAGAPELQARDPFAWNLAEAGLKPGDLIQYWALATDRNTITGPGQTESRRFTLFIVSPQLAAAKLDLQLGDFAQVMEELVRLQRENRAQTTAGVAFETLVIRQVQIRTMSGKLARAMEQGAVPLQSMVQSLDELVAGLMADAVHLFETGRDTKDAERAAKAREDSLPVQDKIIAELQAMLARLQRNEQAREALRKLEKTDKVAHQAITEALGKMLEELDRMAGEEREIGGKFEKLPKRPVDEFNEESLETLKEFEKLQEKWGEWAKGKVDELTKLPAGFVDDFGLRPDVKRIYEEIEKAAQRRATEKMEIAIEDIGDPTGGGMMTRMKEDLEVWLPDVADYLQWVLEEPYVQMNVPEMPLPDALEDMMGDLLQEEEEFDETADDITSAWGLNLDQAGWLAVDGNQSSFSAKGKTGNDLPNTNELTGRSGDGRRGQSSGQMVGDTSRALQGRKTPARVGAERYEPGTLKQEGQDDPQGATGGGKKAGAGQRGLQGGTPPDFVKDMQRLSEKQQVIREQAERVAQRLDAAGVTSRRLTDAIELMKSIEKDYRDLRYDDAARRRRVALSMLDAAQEEMDQPTGIALSRAREVPAAMRQELLQAVDEGYPAGYEEILKSYFRALSETEK